VRIAFAWIVAWAVVGATAVVMADDAAEPGQQPARGAHEVAPGHDAAGAAAHEPDLGHANAGPQLEDPSEFKYDLAIYTFIVFVLLLLILGKFAWPVIIEALEEREKRIAGQIEAAEQKHAEARELLAQHEAKLAQAADEVRGLMEEARRDAEAVKAQILAEAKAAAQAEHDRVLREVRNATDGALRELSERSARLAVELAGKIVQQQLNESDHERLIRDAIAKFPSNN